jgi:integral membrane sensor domain MASE1
MADKPTVQSLRKPADLTAGPVPYVWIVSNMLLVVVLDQVGFRCTIPLHQQFPLLNLGLAAALAVAWHRGWRVWPAILVAGLVSGALLHNGWLGSVIHAVGLTAGALGGRALLTLTGFDSRMRAATDVMTLAVLAGPVAALIARVNLGFLMHPGLELVSSFLADWLSGWTGVLMMTPFLFSLNADYFQRWNAARVREWLLVNLLLVGSLLVMLQYMDVGDQLRYPLAYLALPCLFWTSWRFGTAGAALANLLMGIIIALGGQEGLGPFAGNGGMLVMLPAWAFLIFHGLVALLLAAFTDERRIELAHHRQRARFLRQLLDELPCGILLKDITDKPLLVNRRWFQLYGKAGGTEEDQLKHQKSVDAFWRGRELTLLQNLGEVLREESESMDFEGNRVELLLTKQAAYFEERGERLLMVVADDISSGRASLREVRGTLERVRASLAVAEVGLWDWHIPSGVIRYDKEFSKLTGMPERPEGLPVPVWQESIHPDDRRQFQHDMLQHLHHQAELFATRFRFQRENSWTWLVVRGRIVEKDSRNLGVRMIGTLQHARATVTPLPDPNKPVTA